MQLPLRLHELLPLRTPRLRLVELDLSHLSPLAAMLADPVVMRYFPRVMTKAESEQWLRRTIDRYRRHGTGLLAVLQDRDGTTAFLGDCGLQVRTFAGRAHLELGYHFTRAAWGRGYATEAAQACVTLALRHLAVSEVIALIRPENVPSIGVARRIGMSRAGCVLHSGLVHDVWRLTREACEALALQ
ncbi:GNAT family N-acetyltransferase [Luteitalea pratensis]|nr:GNAT family N-acetyltransferase [Luteitalea pratensis]